MRVAGRSIRPARCTALLAAAGILLAACGSTVAQSGSGDPEASGVNSGLAGVGSTSQAGGSAPAGTDGGELGAAQGLGFEAPGASRAGVGGVAGSGAATSPIAAPVRSGPVSAPAPRAAVGRGVTSSAISIGFQVTKNVQAAFAAVGASGSPADELQIVHALVRWVNDTGGFAGRRVIPVIHETDITNGTFAEQAQAACADLTEDHHVFAVGTSPVGDSDAMLGCLAAHHTPDIEQAGWEFDDSYYTRYPGMLYQPGHASPNRWAKAYVDTLDRIGYFSRGAKVGLVRFDSPVFQRMSDSVLKPELARVGHRLTKEVAIGHPGALADFGGMNADIGSAIVALRSAGVDHVMFLGSLELPFFFMKQAESQSYRPAYGLSTSDDAEELQVNEAVQQLHGAVIAGWSPPLDVGNQGQPPGNAAWSLCRRIMTKYGVVNQTGFYVQQPCDTVLFLRTVLAKVPAFTNEAFRQVVESLGTSYNSPLTFTTRFGEGRYNGPASLRVARYVDRCACFRYSGPTYPMP